ncbi:MAG: hypothetical protein AAGF87_01225 [Bacteroidota bacterium]
MRSFPAKVLLFGEHTVLYEGQALAIPFERFAARWVQKAVVDQRLLDFGNYLRKSEKINWLLTDQLLEDVTNGWQLASNVPLGYGVGSSGTVCAAVYARYVLEGDKDLTNTRHRLAQMEAFFHGSSSGLDPIVSLCNSPILVDASGCREVAVSQDALEPFFLLDSGQARSSDNIISELKRRFETDGEWQDLVREAWMQPSQKLIKAVTTDQNKATIERQVRRLSQFQFEQLGHLIPMLFHQYKQNAGFCLKLCGAGGGGFLIGYAFDRKLTMSVLKEYKTYWLFNDSEL